MKKLLLLGLGGLCAFTAGAQNAEPYVMNTDIAVNMSANGNYVVLQDYFSNVTIFNTYTKALDFIQEAYPGNGNCVANNGIVVGQDIYETSVGTIFKGGQSVVPSQLKAMNLSSIDGITPDGSRACGYISNDGATYVVPCYFDLDENSNIVSINVLPYPEKDFLGSRPQFGTAVWISDDGRTIAGQIVDATGFYTYPAVYKQGDNGEWTCITPSYSLFNPDDAPLPTFPEFEDCEPVVTDFMTPNNKARYEEALKEYQTSGGIDPNQNLAEYMTDEEMEAFNQAIEEYATDPLAYYYSLIDKYWTALNQATKGSSFALGSMTLNPQGTILASPLASSDDESVSDNFTGFELVVFDLEANNFKKIQAPNYGLIPKQILEDGTIICLDYFTNCDFVLLPDADSVITLEEFLGQTHPTWVPWMQENLDVTMVPTPNGRVDMVKAGFITFSRDCAIMAGGYQGDDDTFSYIFGLENAGVEGIEADLTDGRIVVFDLMGCKVLDSKNVDDLNSLPAGLYIINGKKVMIK